MSNAPQPARGCRATSSSSIMKILPSRNKEEGKVGWVLMWLLGIPIPVLLIIFLMRGCT
jgi:hypothetical protein